MPVDLACCFALISVVLTTKLKVFICRSTLKNGDCNSSLCDSSAHSLRGGISLDTGESTEVEACEGLCHYPWIGILFFIAEIENAMRLVRCSTLHTITLLSQPSRKIIFID
jgi:hypothetical protein